jgi:hypothetical protein
MKRSREEEEDASADADGVKRVRMTPPVHAVPPLFGVLPLEIFVNEILPATGQARLVRALLALTCHAGTACTQTMVLARSYSAERRLLVDAAILAGEEWQNVAKWALEIPDSRAVRAFRVSPLTTLDAIITINDPALVEIFYHRYNRNWRAVHSERCAVIANLPKKMRKAQRAYTSPLDLAAYHGHLDAIRALVYYGYPSLFESATLRPCIDSGSIVVFEWVARTTGIGVFFGFDEDDMEPSGDAYFEFCWRIGKRGTLAFMRKFQNVMRKYGHDSVAVCVEAVMRGAARAGQLELLDNLIREGYICGRVVEAATQGRQLDVLGYCLGKLRADAMFDGGVGHRYWDSGDIRWSALASGEPALLACIDANAGLLVDRGFTRDDLVTAMRYKYWGGMEWLMEQKHMSPRGLLLSWDHGACDPIILSWLAKRGVRFPLSQLSSLLNQAAASARPYPYERWLADTLFDRHREQIAVTPDRDYIYPDGFYGELAHLPPRLGWQWGFERGIRFPSTIYPWMRSASVHTQCHTILKALFARVAS